MGLYCVQLAPKSNIYSSQLSALTQLALPVHSACWDLGDEQLWIICTSQNPASTELICLGVISKASWNHSWVGFCQMMLHLSSHSLGVDLVFWLELVSLPFPPDPDVIVGTVHKAKGLEFDTVMVNDDFTEVPCCRHEMRHHSNFSYSECSFPISHCADFSFGLLVDGGICSCSQLCSQLSVFDGSVLVHKISWIYQISHTYRSCNMSQFTVATCFYDTGFWGNQYIIVNF